MEIEIFTFNPFAVNCYVIHNNSECLIIDPSFYYENEKNTFAEYLDKNNLRPKLMIATHGHIDHIFGSKFLKEKYNIPFYLNPKDEILLKDAVKHAKFFFNLEMEEPPQPDKFITENDIINFDDKKLKILEVPGHTPGHIAIVSEELKAVFTGDTLFKGTIGRTDLPGGDLDLLLESIHYKIFALDDDFIVYPGHGERTNIGTEKRDNPFL